jgi:hypothetical protein
MISATCNEKFELDVEDADKSKRSREICKAFGISRGGSIAENVSAVESHVNRRQLGLSPLGLQYGRMEKKEITKT